MSIHAKTFSLGLLGILDSSCQLFLIAITALAHRDMLADHWLLPSELSQVLPWYWLGLFSAACVSLAALPVYVGMLQGWRWQRRTRPFFFYLGLSMLLPNMVYIVLVHWESLPKVNVLATLFVLEKCAKFHSEVEQTFLELADINGRKMLLNVISSFCIYAAFLCSIQNEHFLEKVARQKIFWVPSPPHPFRNLPGFRVIERDPREELKITRFEDSKGRPVEALFYPMDYPPCPDEIAAFSERTEEFRLVGCEALACSSPYESDHRAWAQLSLERPLKVPWFKFHEYSSYDGDFCRQPLLRHRCDHGMQELPESLALEQLFLFWKPQKELVYQRLYVLDGSSNVRLMHIGTDPTPVKTSQNSSSLLPLFEKYGKVCSVRRESGFMERLWASVRPW